MQPFVHPLTLSKQVAPLEMFGSERIAKVPTVKSALLATLESYPPKILISVTGEAPTGGWNPKGQLIEYVYFVQPVDGIYEFDFVTESPEPGSIQPQVDTPVTALYVIDSIPTSFAGVKINGSENSVIAKLDDPSVSFSSAKLFALGVATSGGGG